jgi:hypothetical protein
MSDCASGPDGENSAGEISGGVIRGLRCADNGRAIGRANNTIEESVITVRNGRIHERRVASNDDIGEKTPCYYHFAGNRVISATGNAPKVLFVRSAEVDVALVWLHNPRNGLQKQRNNGVKSLSMSPSVKFVLVATCYLIAVFLLALPDDLIFSELLFFLTVPWSCLVAMVGYLVIHMTIYGDIILRGAMVAGGVLNVVMVAAYRVYRHKTMNRPRWRVKVGENIE